MRLVRWLTIAACVTLAVPPAAGALTFGANLSARTATANTSCGYPPYYPGWWPYAESCTFFSTATPGGEAAETDVVPLPDPAAHGDQHGTITQVRIKTGAGAAGPAKLTVLRAHRAVNGGESACCVGQAESAQFTLSPESIVHVNTDLPVASLYDAGQRIYSYDVLALSVLDGSTPIPAEFSGDPGGYCSAGFLPYVQTGQERFTGEYGVCGYLVLMQADMTVDEGGAGGGEPDNRFRLIGRPRTTKRGVRLALGLPGPGRVVATATAGVPAAGRARTSRTRRPLVARRAVKAPRAGRYRLLLKPSRAARKLIRRHGRLRAKLGIAYTPSGGKPRSLVRRATFR
jgi:hypothetical protein